uniref:Uncharacterized protein n=1 Tax=Arundo donax TaxID=35708 RepID=A0A0A9FBS3_ARUDO
MYCCSGCSEQQAYYRELNEVWLINKSWLLV